MSAHVPTSTQSLSSSQCSSSQQSNAQKNIVFTDGSMTFRDSWTCHIQNCTIRERIIQCNSEKSDCILNWSCQQCIYGGSKLQCKICINHCLTLPCFTKCYSYLCSDSLRAYQCYYQSEYCYINHISNPSSTATKQPKLSELTLESISTNCKQCALDDQDVDACYFCFNACSDHSCWNNCSINSNFNLYPISIGHGNYSNVTSTNSNPILLTPNAIYGIMAMIGLICLIFGFWMGKNCSAHSLSKACCKMCVFWCDDDKCNDFDEYEEESAWNWKSINGSKSRGKITKKYHHNNNNNNNDLSRESLNVSGHTITPMNNHKINHKLPLNKHNQNINNYGTTHSNNNKLIVNRDLQIRFPMTPLSSRELPRQQNVELSPDVRVAHFSTPKVVNVDKNDSIATFPFSAHNVDMDRMKSIGSDEDDAPTVIQTTNFYDLDNKIKKRKSKKKPKNNNINKIILNRDDSFDTFVLEDEHKSNISTNISHKIYSKDDMIVSGSDNDIEYNNNMQNITSNDKLLNKPKQKRAISTGTLPRSQTNKKIIVLHNRNKVVSPPPIKSKSEFQMLLRPTMSADAIALKKINQK